MIQVKEINKNRKAKFKRLLVEYVNNRIDADALLERSYIYKNLLELAEAGERFYTIGKRYGLLKEFRENCIPC